jgi:hypothetical protein
MAYSPDGVTWTAVGDSAFGNTDIKGIAWGGTAGNEKFVAVGAASKMAYSPDGATWTEVNPGDFNTFWSITWGGGKFVAGSYGKMAYSPDGVTWTEVSDTPFVNVTERPGENSDIYGIAWGGGKFVMVGPAGMAYSPDGVTWTKVDTTINPFDFTILYSIGWGGPAGQEKFVVGGQGFHDDGGKMAYSSDGVIWTEVSDSPFTTELGGVHGIAYGGGKFVAVDYSGEIAYADAE